MTLVTERASPGEWVIIEGVSLTFLGALTISIGEVNKLAFIEGTKALIRCPKLEKGVAPVLVDGKKVGNLQIL
jgi:hypothetical protein